MNIQSQQIELYRHIVDLPAPRVFANLVYRAFNPIEEKWHLRIIDDFYKIFENLDDVYENSDKLAQDVLSESVNAALGILAENSIYDVDEQNFLEEHLSKYEIWDEYFELVASQYEAITHETAQKDAYRTQRRLNRSKLVGFGPAPSIENGYRSPQSYANFSNAVDNIGHGIFNMMAKGVTAIGNSIKKDEIFKSQETVQALDSAVRSIILASKAAVVDALNERYGGAIHNYTKEEMKKASAILANVENGRIPESDIQKEILGLFAIYPYDERIYKYLLTNFGADGGKLDTVADYFGITSLQDVKQDLFEAKLEAVSLATLKDCKINLPQLQEFANNLCYQGFEAEAKKYLDKAINEEFNIRIHSTDLSSMAACNENQKLLRDFAQEIGYQNFDAEWIKIVSLAIENDFKREASKYPLDTADACDTNLPILESFAKDIGYMDFDEWARNIRSLNTEKLPAAKGGAALSVAKKGRNWNIYALIAVLSLISFGSLVEYVDRENAKEAARLARQERAIQDQLRQEKEEAEKNKLDQQASAPTPSASENAASGQLSLNGSGQSVAKLSAAAEKAIEEGYVEIKEPAVQACVDAKIDSLRKEIGPDAPIMFAVYNEFAVACGFNI